MKRPAWLRVPSLDLRDAHIYGGLLVMGAGVWMISPAAAVIAVGAVLFLLGMFVPGRR